MAIYAKSATVSGLTALIKEFYCGSDISLKKSSDTIYHVQNAKGKIDGVIVEKIRGNWCFGNTVN